MKLGLALSSFVAVTGAVDIDSKSSVGRHLLSHARRLDANGFSDEWLGGYSIKFQGCHSIKQWNYEADEDNDVRIMSKSLVRFRLCPTDSCSASKAGGCTGGFGDYVVDMGDFMDAWWEASRQDTEYKCWSYLQNSCNCDEDADENQGDDFNKDYCEYDCFNNAAMTECIDRNPYEEEQQGQNNFNVEDYVACGQFKVQNNNKRRELNNQVKYYIGPVCSGQGGNVNLALFSDDQCSVVPDGVTFESLTGYELPYSNTSLVSTSCVSCLEHAEEDNRQQQNGGQADADTVSEACETLYMESGKCEVNYPEGMLATPNNNACTYMEGIKILREDGTIIQSEAKKNAVATSFIVIFAMSFAGMAFYVNYLRTRLGSSRRNPLL